MTTDRLQAVVIGAGWAGEGHTRALRHAGVDVHTICARQMDIVRNVADRLGVPNASIDWRRTLEETKPDIVAVATPAVLRAEPIEMAAELGCHIFCDKPLDINAPKAKVLLDAVTRAGVKHAYAATGCYHPGVAWLAEQVAAGAVGSVREMDVVWRMPVPSSGTSPWSWMDSLALGGGPLNNAIPHLFAIVERILDSQVTRVTGHAVPSRDRAPVVTELHDFREVWGGKPTEEELADCEWRPCDAEGSNTLLAEIQPTGSDGPPIRLTAVMGFSVLAAWPPPGFRIYGDAGTLASEGFVDPHSIRLWTDPQGEPTVLGTPQRLKDALPHFEDDGGAHVLGKWAALARDFVADIEGKDHTPYLTFHDGWRYQVAIDAVREGRAWQELPQR
ncbi:MAG: Gfo/Idh/MocA family oxidoreductase [Anaerolineae bacterium]|nr:Gfo/Idh/MocA family oxidoreductase [Anaerolineae bacterium]